MNGFKSMIRSGQRQSGIKSAGAAIAVILGNASLFPVTASAQVPYQTQTGDMMLFESAGACRVVEKVRASSQGVMCAVFVKTGDVVRKGQVLGHLELDATKLQLDLARHAMTSIANVESAKSQAEAWTVTREETEEAVRRRKMEESRLEWAIAMEKMYRANYELQLDAENTQQIQYDYWKDQYDKRYFRAPVDGVVSEVLVDLGKPVNFATHVFTVSNENTYALPVTVPADLAEAAVSEKTVPVRSSDGKSVGRAMVDSVIDNPGSAGGKILRLLVKAADFPAVTRPKWMGMKFDVLLPQVAKEEGHRAP
jgi:multidrug efflux pump subunit AcrA (membrane-fusion protein)